MIALRTRLAGATVALGVAGLLGGCISTPADRFYTLGKAARPDAAATSAAMQAGGGATPAPSGFIAVGPVTLPDIVDRPQMVVERDAQRVTILETRRWASSLSSEIANRIAGELNTALRGQRAYADTADAPRASDEPSIRIIVRVDRFESDPSAGTIADDLYWIARCEPGSASGGTSSAEPRTGYAELRETAGAGDDPYAALASAHGRALDRASRSIAAAIGAMSSTCKS